MNKEQFWVALVSAILLSIGSITVGVAVLQDKVTAADAILLLTFAVPVVLIGGVLFLRAGAKGKDNGPG